MPSGKEPPKFYEKIKIEAENGEIPKALYWVFSAIVVVGIVLVLL
jgi:hypothetical protein